MVAHTINPSTWEAEVRRFLEVTLIYKASSGQLQLHRETLSQTLPPLFKKKKGCYEFDASVSYIDLVSNKKPHSHSLWNVFSPQFLTRVKPVFYSFVIPGPSVYYS